MDAEDIGSGHHGEDPGREAAAEALLDRPAGDDADEVLSRCPDDDRGAEVGDPVDLTLSGEVAGYTSGDFNAITAKIGLKYLF